MPNEKVQVLCNEVATDKVAIPTWVRNPDPERPCAAIHSARPIQVQSIGNRRDFRYGGEDDLRIGAGGVVEVRGVEDQC